MPRPNNIVACLENNTTLVTSKYNKPNNNAFDTTPLPVDMLFTLPLEYNSTPVISYHHQY